MRFAIFALIVSFGATGAWINFPTGSTEHWVASGAGTAVLIYLRHRVRRRGLRGLWRWGQRAELDEVFHFLDKERGASFWSRLRPRRRYRTVGRTSSSERSASGRRAERYTSCRSFVVVWYQREDGEVIERVRMEPSPGGVQGLGKRDLFSLDDRAMGELFRHLEHHDPKGLRLLEWIVETVQRWPRSEYQSEWLQRQLGTAREERSEQRRDEPGLGTGQSDPIVAARALLGLEEDATEETIRKRMRSLMQRTHSDKGGSDTLFRLVREAGERLIEDARRSHPGRRN